MGMAYQLIGDIKNIDRNWRKAAYFLSSCFFELAADFKSPDEEDNFYSNYYSGMVNHKLIIELGEANNEVNAILIRDAYNYYEKSLRFDDFKKNEISQKQALTQICDIAIKFVEKYGTKEILLTSREYEESKTIYSAP